MIDIVSQSVERIEKLKVPVATVARVAGLSDTSLRAILNGSRNCPRDAAIKIDAALRMLARLVEDAAPLPLDLKNAHVLHTILDKIKKGELRIIAHEDPASFLNFPHAITIGERYFCGRSEQGRVLMSVLQIDSKSMPFQVAEQVSAKLREQGLADVQIVLSKRRINAKNVDECWGKIGIRSRCKRPKCKEISKYKETVCQPRKPLHNPRSTETRCGDTVDSNY